MHKKLKKNMFNFFKRKHNLVLVFLIFLGFFLRIYKVTEIPGVRMDDVIGGRTIQLISKGYILPLKSFQRILHSIFTFYLSALVMKILGTNFFALKFTALFFDILALMFVYKIIMKEFGKRTVLIFSAMLMLTPYFVVSSRLPSKCNFARFTFSFFVFSLYYLLKHKRVINYFLFGLSYGLIMQTQPISLFVIIPAILFIINIKKISIFFNKKIFFTIIAFFLSSNVVFFTLINQFLNFKSSGIHSLTHPISPNIWENFLRFIKSIRSFLSELFFFRAFFAQAPFSKLNFFVISKYFKLQFPFNYFYPKMGYDYIYFFWIIALFFSFFEKNKFKGFFIILLIIYSIVFVKFVPTYDFRYFPEIMFSITLLFSIGLNKILSFKRLKIFGIFCLFFILTQYFFGIVSALSYYSKYGNHPLYSNDKFEAGIFVQNISDKTDAIITDIPAEISFVIKDRVIFGSEDSEKLNKFLEENKVRDVYWVIRSVTRDIMYNYYLNKYGQNNKLMAYNYTTFYAGEEEQVPWLHIYKTNKSKDFDFTENDEYITLWNNYFKIFMKNNKLEVYTWQPFTRSITKQSPWIKQFDIDLKQLENLNDFYLKKVYIESNSLILNFDNTYLNLILSNNTILLKTYSSLDKNFVLPANIYAVSIKNKFIDYILLSSEQIDFCNATEQIIYNPKFPGKLNIQTNCDLLNNTLMCNLNKTKLKLSLTY